MYSCTTSSSSTRPMALHLEPGRCRPASVWAKCSSVVAHHQKGRSDVAGGHALRAAGRKPRSTSCWVVKGRRDGSPHFGQVVHPLNVLKHSQNAWVFMPSPRNRPGQRGDARRKGRSRGVGSSPRKNGTRRRTTSFQLQAELDSAVWALVKALSTWVSEAATTGDRMVVRECEPLTDRQKQDHCAEGGGVPTRRDVKKLRGVQHWVPPNLCTRDAAEGWRPSPRQHPKDRIDRLQRAGLAKTLLPRKAVAQARFPPGPSTRRLAEASKPKLRAHLAKRGYGTVRGPGEGWAYQPNTDRRKLVADQSVECGYESEPGKRSLSPRLAGSWPG